MSIENKTVVIEKYIEKLEDFYSVIGEIENKLKETTKLILLVLEPSDEPFDNIAQHLDVKLEEQEVDESKQLASITKEEDIDHDDSDDKQANVILGVNLFTGEYLTGIEQKNDGCDASLVPKSIKIKAKKQIKSEDNFPKQKRNKGGLCVDCGVYFKRIHEHRTNIHEKRVYNYTCPICSLEFKSVKYQVYYDHKQECEAAATGIMKYECPTCGLKLPTVRKNIDHQRKCNGSYKYKLNKPQLPKHVCPYDNCEYKTTRKDNLQNHINREHLKIPIEKNHSCDQCGNSYVNLNTLKEHIKMVHDKIRDLFCSDCGASFSTPQVLRKHKLIHSDARTCQCPYCPKAFKQQSVLYRHKLSCPMKPDK